MEVLVATTAEWPRRHGFLPPMESRQQREVRADWIAVAKIWTQLEKSAHCRLSQQTVEPVSVIVK